jgi:RimJ/RimL family protein N-acetyltransferase
MTPPALLERRLETARLVLTPPELADFEESAAMWADAAVTRHIAPRPSTREEAWARLLRYAGHWALKGHGFWTVRERAGARFVGELGFADFERDMAPPLAAAAEAGWALVATCHGQGYGLEALTAALSWAARHLAGDRLSCIIDPTNAPSLRLAGRCGFSLAGEALYRNETVLVLDRPIRG